MIYRFPKTGFYFAVIISIVLFISCSSGIRYTKDGSESSGNYYQIGNASYYADEFNGKKTASGEVYNMNDLTAAHPDLPFNTMLKITNLSNRKTVIVRVNDRMPKNKNRIIDLSYSAAVKLDMIKSGIEKIKIELVK